MEPRSVRELADSMEKVSTGNVLLVSQYKLSFRPMPVGMRKRVWEEGWNYRNQRRKDGFNHFRLEWRR